MQKALVCLQILSLYAAFSALYYNYHLFKVDENVLEWHTTIFRPYFAPSLFCMGLAFLLSVLIVVRKIFYLENWITIKPIDFLGVCVAVGVTIIAFYNLANLFSSRYSKSQIEWFDYLSRTPWHYKLFYIGQWITGLLIPLLLYRENIRRNVKWAFFISVFLNIWFYIHLTVNFILTILEGNS